MNMKEDIVPFSSELKHVKSYLLLQKQRFEEQFEFELDIQKEVEEILVPKMILQPIVENCFKHGFDQQEEKELILIEAWLQDEELVCIRVNDNGIGVNEEQLKKIRKELYHGSSKEERRREAIGLKNIYDRLQIYYANQCEMFITSSLESGFTVTIQIPKDMPKEVHHS
jgi:two-component system sensor histidine kinase YesM